MEPRLDHGENVQDLINPLKGHMVCPLSLALWAENINLSSYESSLISCLKKSESLDRVKFAWFTLLWVVPKADVKIN